jgi:hypothetical protein
MSGAEWHARVECSGKCEPLMPDTACLLRAL